MKVILSRKGFDSSNGGIVSPIMEDGTLLSLPIPLDDNNTFDDLIYKQDLYSKILKDLKYKGKNTCHVDPDLEPSRRVKKIDGWIPIFGQCDQAASYLQNTVNVELGDLFLFFGNYHKVKKTNGTYSYIKRTGDFYSDNDLQVIWGYMQVGKIITDKEEQTKYNWHPHSYPNHTSKPINIMYVASDRLSFNSDLPGAGVFKFSKNRVLTLENCSKATWIKRPIYDTNSIVGDRKNSASEKNKEYGIYYAGIWQELGLKETKEAEAWAKDLFKNE